METSLRQHLLRSGVFAENIDLIQLQDPSLITVEDLARGANSVKDADEWAKELGLVTSKVVGGFRRAWLEAVSKLRKTGAVRRSSSKDAQQREVRRQRRLEAHARDASPPAPEAAAPVPLAPVLEREAPPPASEVLPVPEAPEAPGTRPSRSSGSSMWAELLKQRAAQHPLLSEDAEASEHFKVPPGPKPQAPPRGWGDVPPPPPLAGPGRRRLSQGAWSSRARGLLRRTSEPQLGSNMVENPKLRSPPEVGPGGRSVPPAHAPDSRWGPSPSPGGSERGEAVSRQRAPPPSDHVGSRLLSSSLPSGGEGREVRRQRAPPPSGQVDRRLLSSSPPSGGEGRKVRQQRAPPPSGQVGSRLLSSSPPPSSSEGREAGQRSNPSRGQSGRRRTPPVPSGHQSFSIYTPRPQEGAWAARRGLPDLEEPAAAKLELDFDAADPAKRPARVAEWTLQQVLAAAKPAWGPEDRFYCAARLKKIGVTSVEALAEAVARDLNQRLLDGDLGTLAKSSIAGMRRVLWEDPDAEAYGEDVVDEGDALPDACAKLASELFAPLRRLFGHPADEPAASAPDLPEACKAASACSVAEPHKEAPPALARRARPKPKPKPCPRRAPAVGGGDLLSQLMALEQGDGMDEDEDDEESVPSDSDESGELLSKQASRSAAAPSKGARQLPAAAGPVPVPMDAQDGVGSDAGEEEEGPVRKQADIFDAPSELWLRARAAKGPEAAARTGEPAMHRLASLCDWEGEGKAEPEATLEQSSYEIFDAPAKDWTMLPESPEETPADSAQASAEKPGMESQPAEQSAGPDEARRTAAMHEEPGCQRQTPVAELTLTQEAARTLGACAGIAVAFRAAALSRSFRDWILMVLPSLMEETPADIFLAGGHRVEDRWVAGSSLMRLCMRTLEWDPLPPMSQKRSCATTVSSMGQVYVLGGFNGRELLDSAERFDISARAWETLPPMSAPRYSCGAAAIWGSIYVVGGVGNQALPHDAYERFDTDLHRWEPVPATSLGCSTDVAVAAVRQRLYVVGFIEGHCQFERLSPASGRWERLPPLEPGLAKNVLVGAVGIGPRLYVCSLRILAIRIFNCCSDTWEPPPKTGGMPDELLSSSCRPLCATASCGSLLIVGTWEEKAQRSGDEWPGGAVLGCVMYSGGLAQSKAPAHVSHRAAPDGRARHVEKQKQKTWQILPLERGCLRWGCAASAARC